MSGAQFFANRVENMTRTRRELKLNQALEKTSNIVLIFLMCLAAEKDTLTDRKIRCLKLMEDYDEAVNFFKIHNVPKEHYMYKYQLK